MNFFMSNIPSDIIFNFLLSLPLQFLNLRIGLQKYKLSFLPTKLLCKLFYTFFSTSFPINLLSNAPIPLSSIPFSRSGRKDTAPFYIS